MGNNTGSRYVAVGENGAVITSDNLNNWTDEKRLSHPLLGGSALVPAGQVIGGTQLGAPADPAKKYFSFTARVRKQRPGITLTRQAGVTMADFSPDGVVRTR